MIREQKGNFSSYKNDYWKVKGDNNGVFAKNT